MKKFGLACMGAAMLMLGSAVSAQAYVGDWEFSNNPGGSEILNLWDNSDGMVRILRGSDRYCGTPGASYATMRSTIRANGNNQIVWWEDRVCGGDNHVRICVENIYGNTRCSTYYDLGWQ